MRSIFHWAEQLARGCGWFACVVGLGCGWAVALFFQNASWLNADLAHQMLTHVLFGHLPTVLVSAFVLLRVGFQLATDDSTRTEWNHSNQVATYALACALVGLLAWAWFFLSAMAGFLIGLVQTAQGSAFAYWTAYWVDFDLGHLLHAVGRMVLLSLALSAMTFIEVNLLRAHRDQLGMLMSRFMTLGMFLIVAIEALDITLQ